MGIITGLIGFRRTSFLIRGTTKSFSGRLDIEGTASVSRNESTLVTQSKGSLYCKENLPTGTSLLARYNDRNVLVQIINFVPRTVDFITTGLGHHYEVQITYLNLNKELEV